MHCVSPSSRLLVSLLFVLCACCSEFAREAGDRNCSNLLAAPNAMPDGTVGQPYSARMYPNTMLPSITHRGGPLPPGLQLESGNPALVRGTPTATGSYTSHYTVSMMCTNENDG